MFAQWCFTASKVAIGRPNCSRILAYSLAWSVTSRATPVASAANSSRARSVSTPRAPGSTAAGAPVRVTRAIRLVGSRLAGTSVLTPPAAVSTTSTSSPWATSSTSARCPLTAIPAFPVPSATSPPSATVPIAPPLARPGSSRACRSGGPAAAITALAITVGTNGPGATARPNCSATITSSGRPKPDPPYSSGRCSPSQPSLPSSPQKSGSPSVLASSRFLAVPRAPRAPRNSDTVWASALWSSEMAIDMTKPYVLGSYSLRSGRRGFQDAGGAAVRHTDSCARPAASLPSLLNIRPVYMPRPPAIDSGCRSISTQSSSATRR